MNDDSSMNDESHGRLLQWRSWRNSAASVPRISGEFDETCLVDGLVDCHQRHGVGGRFIAAENLAHLSAAGRPAGAGSSNSRCTHRTGFAVDVQSRRTIIGHGRRRQARQNPRCPHRRTVYRRCTARVGRTHRADSGDWFQARWKVARFRGQWRRDRLGSRHRKTHRTLSVFHRAG